MCPSHEPRMRLGTGLTLCCHCTQAVVPKEERGGNVMAMRCDGNVLTTCLRGAILRTMAMQFKGHLSPCQFLLHLYCILCDRRIQSMQAVIFAMATQLLTCASDLHVTRLYL